MDENEIVISALKYYIQNLEMDIKTLCKIGDNVGFLPMYVEEARAALAKLEAAK